ncbi:MAG: hypothetical protein WBX50_01940 [Candidatus Deferrimicrobiaceae bacterium]
MRVRFRLFPQGKIRALAFSYDDGTVHDWPEESDGGRLRFAGLLRTRHGEKMSLAGGIALPGSL